MRVRTLSYGHAVDAAEPAHERREIILGRLTDKAARRGLRIAQDLLRNPAEAEDAVQDALARACEACDRLRDLEAAESWFYRILTNVCLRGLRRRRLRQLFFGQANEVAENSAASSETPADRALARQRDVALLVSALDRLPVKQRTALLLRYGHDMSISEIADMLGVKPATVKTHLVRGLHRLRKIMESPV
ncbi:MAG: sigma-70 family RNA polymerase sigma factor [Proteobacteria bacterium]|nr:sigma-70 family RNA polymerase sigma factor [Pseudomonadota bacterium]